MKINKWLGSAAMLSVPMLLSLLGGCERRSNTSGGGDNPQSKMAPAGPGLNSDSALATDHESDSQQHGHKDGQHGGIIVSLGRDSYHIEAVVATDGQIRLFTLGKDESRVIDIESQTLKGFVKAGGDAEAQEVSFQPAPQEGDAANRTSLFVCKLPQSLMGKSLDVTIPNIRIDGERFRLGFSTVQVSHNESSALPDKVMPDKVSSNAEQDLYLTPGGHYTTADIAANGTITASQKFKGTKSDHNMNPNVGDPICPISGTKANAKFTWIIGGKPYQFCCPPCVDEFLTNAKTSKDPLPDPQSFIKK